MGYSCSSIASEVKLALLDILQKGTDERSSNCWTYNGRRYFFEVGRENSDGAITGTVQVFTDETHCLKAGSFRINPDGKIARFPATNKGHRAEAFKVGTERFNQRFSSQIHPTTMTLTQDQFVKEFQSFYALRTGMESFADGGGEISEIHSYQAGGYTPYEAVSRQIEKYSMDDLGTSESKDREAIKRGH